MENERELGKGASEHTDDGYSEKKLALQFDQGKSSKQALKMGNIFAPKKKTQTVFQAQKEEEI